MKLNITTDESHFITGCVNININDYDESSFEEVAHSSCDMVILSQCLGSLPYVKSIDFLTKCASRVRKSGGISIALVDFEALCISYLNGSTESNEVSEVLKENKSAMRFYEVKQLLSKAGITLRKVERKNNLLLINGIKK